MLSSQQQLRDNRRNVLICRNDDSSNLLPHNRAIREKWPWIKSIVSFKEQWTYLYMCIYCISSWFCVHCVNDTLGFNRTTLNVQVFSSIKPLNKFLLSVDYCVQHPQSFHLLSVPFSKPHCTEPFYSQIQAARQNFTNTMVTFKAEDVSVCFSKVNVSGA